MMQVVSRLHALKNATPKTCHWLLKMRFVRIIEILSRAPISQTSYTKGECLKLPAVNQRIGKGEFEFVSLPGLGHLDRS
jgi:hypothetical protein